MLLALDDDEKKGLGVLQEVSSDVLCEICQLTFDSLDNGVNSKAQQALAKKFDLMPEVVQEAVDRLLFLFTEASKHYLNEVDFYDSLLTAGLNEGVCKLLSQQYVAHKSQVLSILKEMAPSLPQYHNLEWRLEVQLASRSLHHQVVPQVLLKLHTRDGDKHDVKVLQSDPVNLIHLTKSLEAALDEIKTSHCRRILRNL